MRQILIDHARVRGPKYNLENKLEFDMEGSVSGDDPSLEQVDLLALDQALERLRAIDEQQHQYC